MDMNYAPFILVVGLSFVFPLVLFIRALYEEPRDFKQAATQRQSEPSMKRAA